MINEDGQEWHDYCLILPFIVQSLIMIESFCTAFTMIGHAYYTNHSYPIQVQSCPLLVWLINPIISNLNNKARLMI